MSHTEPVIQSLGQANLHLIETERGEVILFNPETLQISVADADARDDAPPQTPSPHENHSSIVEPRPESAIHRTEEGITRPHLSRLTLHVSNTCNLSCGYCYASGGDYQLGRSMMGSDTALELLAKAFQAFDVDSLMFFGGEPSLNTDAIAEACKYVEQLHRDGAISHLPEFVVISNLYQPSDKFLEVCKRFNLHVTVSIDGPPSVHDANRPNLAGRGSYSAIHSNYLRAKEMGISLKIQCTYGPAHIEQGITVLDLMKFFHREFGEQRTHIARVTCSPISSDILTVRQAIDSFCDAIEYMVRTCGTVEYLAIEMGEDLLTSIAGRTSIAHYCPAGNTELTISPKGELYPCFMFVGQEELNMGPLNGPNWLSAQGRKVLQRIRVNSKDNHPICRECWAKRTCTGCIGGDYYATKTLEVKPNCAIIMANTAEAIVRLAERAQNLPIGHYGYRHRYAYLDHLQGQACVSAGTRGVLSLPVLT